MSILEVPRPPLDPVQLLAWAETHQVVSRLDDVLLGNGEPHDPAVGPPQGTVSTYREVLGPDSPWSSFFQERSRGYLHRVAVLVATDRHRRGWMDQNGADPKDEVLADLLSRLRVAQKELQAVRQHSARPVGTFERGPVVIGRDPSPWVRSQEWPLLREAPGKEDVALMLLGWNEGPLRWVTMQKDRFLQLPPPAPKIESAIEAIIDLIRDPRAAQDHEDLAELLRIPAWRFALGTLDKRLAEIDADASPRPSGRAARLGFCVVDEPRTGLTIMPVVQRPTQKGRYSKGTVLPWRQLPTRPNLTDADRRAYEAMDNRFVKNANPWTGSQSAEQIFGVLRELMDHPAVFLEGHEQIRLDIRQGRLRLRFGNAGGGGLAPHFDLLGVTLSVVEANQALRDGAHVIYINRPVSAAPQILLAQLAPQAAAVVRALGVAPGTFPQEAHDALASRLELLQESMDIEFPSQWTRTIANADGRVLARLELLVSGAIRLRLGVRPVRFGPVFSPGEGPSLVLEGDGRDRHGARRDQTQERRAAHGLAEQLGLAGCEEQEPWCWRVGEGDLAMRVVDDLKNMGEAVLVEWADDEGLLAMGSIGRGDMRLRVGDTQNWFEISGGAKIAGTTVPLAMLLAAIRDGRRFVAVGDRGFARIEESLRRALTQAEGAVFEVRGGLELSSVATDALMGLVEHEAQVEASVAFGALRLRMKEGADVAPQLPDTLGAVLRPYQKAGVAWMARLSHWGAGAVLADEMGLGKTVQTLAILLHRAQRGPALIVAPTSVGPIWMAEAARFTPELRMRLYRGADRAACLATLGPGDVLVTSYQIVTMDADLLGQVTFGSLVLDEAQAVKNASTERARVLRSLHAEWRLGLTGTPVENHLGDLWSLFRVLSPGLLGSWERFRARYAQPIEKFGDDDRRKNLAEVIRPFVLRRLKSEVARELPARTDLLRVVRLSAEEQKLYDELRLATLEAIRQAKQDPDRDGKDLRFVLLAALTRLRQLCCHPRLVYPGTTAGSAKSSYLLELLATLRADGHRVLVFSQFRSFLHLLAPRLQQHGFSVLTLDGTTPSEVRTQRIASFQAQQADVFLISLKAGGFGLNLTAADTVIHLDPWWNPAVEDQASARAHRIGQTRPVTTIRILAQGTIEEAVLDLHARKRALAASVLQGSDTAAALGTDDLIDLIRRSPSS